MLVTLSVLLIYNSKPVLFYVPEPSECPEHVAKRLNSIPWPLMTPKCFRTTCYQHRRSKRSNQIKKCSFTEMPTALQDFRWLSLRAVIDHDEPNSILQGHMLLLDYKGRINIFDAVCITFVNQKTYWAYKRTDGSWHAVLICGSWTEYALRSTKVGRLTIHSEVFRVRRFERMF